MFLVHFVGVSVPHARIVPTTDTKGRSLLESWEERETKRVYKEGGSCT
jgi:hypothetical protein